MADAPRLDVKTLRALVRDAYELAKGSAFYDEGHLRHLARYENKLFAEAYGASASPYKVQVVLGERASARCTCMASRSRPICKHAAALLVAWTHAPESFAVSDVAPIAPADVEEVRRREVRRGKSDAAELMRLGIAQVETLVRELATAGVASLGRDRLEQMRVLAANLRESRLRRLSGRTLALAVMLEQATEGAEHAELDASAYADLLADLLLTARKLEKHAAGEPLEDRYVEELIGKTWKKSDRAPIEGLALFEYAFSTRVTPDDFVIRESRFFDLRSGEHYAEKQIVPGFLSRRTEPKRSWSGLVLEGAAGRMYPGFAPRRIEVESAGEEKALDGAALERALAAFLPDVGAALSALAERRRDPFAPDRLAVALRVETVLAEGRRAQLVDEAESALHLAEDPIAHELFASALRDAKLRGVIGDVGAEGALPAIYPLAAIVETAAGLSLQPLRAMTLDAAELRKKSKKKRGTRKPGVARVSRWAELARAAGLSHAAITLAEVREELAGVLLTGLGGLTARFAEPLAVRLRELDLEKQALLLEETAAIEDPARRLEGFVKLYQVLGIGLARLTGAAHVDRAALERVPLYESVFVQRPEETLSPEETAARMAKGALGRFEAAVHAARWYGAMPAEELARAILPAWADGAAAPHVARAFVSRPRAGVEAARRVLEANYGRVAAATAVQVLAAIAGGGGGDGGDPEAEELLEEVARRHREAAIRFRALAALRASGARGALLARDVERASRSAGGVRARVRAAKLPVAAYVEALASAPSRDLRIGALEGIEALGDPAAVPWVRVAFASDANAGVRERAAVTLAMLVDTESVETFVRMVVARDEDEERARAGARALGALGDMRGAEVLIAAFLEGWAPKIVGEALRAMGVAALGKWVRALEQRPELAGRRAVASVLEALPVEDVAAELVGRLEAIRAAPDFVERAEVLLTLGGQAAAEKIRALRPELAESKDKRERALWRRVKRALDS